jgi:PilZ domain-containing protein
MPQGNVRWLRGIATGNAMFGRRWKTKWAAKLRTAAAQLPCTVVDISVAGARLRIYDAPDEGNAVSLFIGNEGAISARVVWCHDNSVGLRFVEEQPWILDLIPYAESERPSHTPGHRS